MLTSAVTMVRPYGPRIRERVSALLERAGLFVRPVDIIPKGTSDEDIVERLRTRAPEILLIPFHAHRDEHGEGVNGIDLAERIFAALPHLAGVPILMPASITALAAARLRLSPLGARPLIREVRTRILLLDESDLDEPASVDAVIEHVRRQR